MMKVNTFFILFALFASCAPAQKESAETAALPTVTGFTSPTGIGAQLPHLTTGGDGQLYLSWVVEDSDGLAILKYARLDGDQWTAPEMIASGNNWFVNWADYPTIAADNSGNLIAHYPAKSAASTYAYDVNVVLKPASTATWSAPVLAHTDGTQTEHGFVAMLPQNDGTFLMSWLDGRFTGGGDHNDEGHGGGGAMTVRTAVIDMEGKLSEEAELDHRVCDCCQTGITLTASGPVAVYRDRSDNEIRDMYFVKKTAGEWSAPAPVAQDDWNIAGCPVNGPRIASFGESVAVAWFTAAEGKPKVKLAFAADQGSFAEPILIDGTQPLGRVDVVMLDENTAVVSWLNNDAGSAIKYVTVDRTGQMSAPTVVANTSESRSSGFPQMELLDGQLYFAWTVSKDDEFGIEMKRVEL
jgi:hypothetical protein